MELHQVDGRGLESKLMAEVTARFESYFVSQTSQDRAYRFVLENLGPARAENVSFEIRAPTNGEAPFVQIDGHSFPIPLDPKQVDKMLCTVAHGTASSVNVDFVGRMALVHGRRL